MRNYRANPARNFRESVEVSNAVYNELVWDVLDRTYAPFKHAEKRLARHAKASPKAARNWLERQCAPNGENLLNLMAECDELADEVMRLVGDRRAQRSAR